MIKSIKRYCLVKRTVWTACIRLTGTFDLQGEYIVSFTALYITQLCIHSIILTFIRSFFLRSHHSLFLPPIPFPLCHDPSSLIFHFPSLFHGSRGYQSHVILKTKTMSFCVFSSFNGSSLLLTIVWSNTVRFKYLWKEPLRDSLYHFTSC